MNASEHILGGVIATTLTYLVASTAIGEPPTVGGLLTAAVVGIPAGLMLDVIEPAIHPHHRGPAHSIAAFAGLAALANNLCCSVATAPQAKVWGLVGLAGVSSHYVLDSTTSRGLPLRAGFACREIGASLVDADVFRSAHK
jgi:membrane-bound metal-dependent hydrolase YbcI (DUF457 family)